MVFPISVFVPSCIQLFLINNDLNKYDMPHQIVYKYMYVLLFPYIFTCVIFPYKSCMCYYLRIE